MPRTQNYGQARGGGRCRLVGLRGLARQAGQRQTGCRIELPGFRHPVDGLVGWFLRRHGRVLLLLPLETAVPRRKLRGRQRHDLVEIGDFGVAAVVGIDEIRDEFIAPRSLRIVRKTKVIELLGRRRPLESMAQIGNRRGISSRRAKLKCRYCLVIILVGLKINPEHVGRITVALSAGTLPHLPGYLGSGLFGQKLQCHVRLRLGIAEISRFPEVAQSSLRVLLQSITRFQVMANVVITAGDALLD